MALGVGLCECWDVGLEELCKEAGDRVSGKETLAIGVV
jgi:hypothetical protein